MSIEIMLTPAPTPTVAVRYYKIGTNGKRTLMETYYRCADVFLVGDNWEELWGEEWS